jgi:hypothetical protein
MPLALAAQASSPDGRAAARASSPEGPRGRASRGPHEPYGHALWPGVLRTRGAVLGEAQRHKTQDSPMRASTPRYQLISTCPQGADRRR